MADKTSFDSEVKYDLFAMIANLEDGLYEFAGCSFCHVGDCLETKRELLEFTIRFWSNREEEYDGDELPDLSGKYELHRNA